MLLPHRYPTLAVLSTAQALYWSCSIIGITLTGLVGQQLAPWPLLATLPLALLVTGSLLTVGPMARWMARHGPRQGLQRGALLGVAGGLVCTASIHWHSFVLLNLGVLLVGAYQASAGYYRFAALEGVDPAHKGRAAAWVVAGGIAAALLAPTLALHSRHLLATPLAGAYLVLALLAATAWAVLQGIPVSRTSPSSAAPAAAAATLTAATPMKHAAITSRRTLWQRPAIRQALLLTACAHGLMILVMNATPLAMHGHGHGKGPGMHRGSPLLTQAYRPEERSVAQPMMEWSNSAVAASMSLASGVLVQSLGWQAVNWAMLPVLCAMAWWLRPGALAMPTAMRTP